MEPLVIFGAGLVAYCGYLSLIDAFRDREREQGLAKRDEIPGERQADVKPAAVTFSGHGRGDGADRRWTRLARGSA